jgi:phosphoglycolate phosphatase
MQNYKAVIFDLDGTLIDSLYDIADSMNSILFHNGYPTFDYEAYKHFVGNGLKNLVYNCLPEDKNNEENVVRCLSMMMDEYGRHYADKTHLYGGIAELLDELTGAGVKISILSNKADELTQKICKKLFNNWHFEIILGASDQFPRKPDPRSALYVARFMEIEPEEILYAGDTNVDMKTANAAGMFAVGVSWGFRSREELKDNNAQLIIDKPSELITKLKI